MEWQPIETAPKDGSTFLTFTPDSDYNGGFDFAEYDLELEDFCKHGCGWQYVTAWMPLPPGPGLKPCIHCGHRGYVERIFTKHLAGLRQAECASCGALHSESRLPPKAPLPAEAPR